MDSPSKCEQIRRKLQICSYVPKNPFLEISFLCNEIITEYQSDILLSTAYREPPT